MTKNTTRFLGMKRPLLKDSRKKKTLCPSTLKLVMTNPTKKAKRASTIKPELVSHITTFTLLYTVMMVYVVHACGLQLES